MSKLRVAMIAPPWLPIPPVGYGGIENVLVALIPELLKLNIEVELFTTGDSKIKSTKNHWLYKNSQYEHIHKSQYESLPITIAHLMFALNIIRKDGGFDIIHDHNGFIGPLTLANTAEDLPPAVHTLHGPPFTTVDRLDIGIPDNLLMWKQFGNSTKLFLIGISQALMKNAPKELNKIILPPVHNSVVVDTFPYTPKKQDYFITLGRFHPDKGQAVAVKACIELGYHLKMAGVVGDIGDPKKLILELANPLSRYRSVADFRYYSDYVFPHLEPNIIEYVGEVNDVAKMSFMKNARALLFPINWDEPFGMVVLEALACGTPVVAMSRGAMPEIIEHGVNGFLAHSEAEFKHYMTKIDEIDPLACRQSVERKFSSSEMARKYAEHYATIVRDFSR